MRVVDAGMEAPHKEEASSSPGVGQLFGAAPSKKDEAIRFGGSPAAKKESAAPCVQGFVRGKSHTQPSTGRKVRTVLHLQSTEPTLQITQDRGPRWHHKRPTHSNMDWNFPEVC